MTTGNEIWKPTAAAAEMIGVTVRTVYRFINDGLLDAYRFGRVIRIKTEDIERFIEQNKLQPGDLGHMFEEPDDDEF